MENIPVDDFAQHPANAASKRTPSTVSARYRNSGGSLLDEISIIVSNERPLENANAVATPTVKPGLPQFYH